MKDKRALEWFMTRNAANQNRQQQPKTGSRVSITLDRSYDTRDSIQRLNTILYAVVVSVTHSTLFVVGIFMLPFSAFSAST